MPYNVLNLTAWQSWLDYLTIDEIMCWLLRAIVDHERMVSVITAWGVWWTGLPHSGSGSVAERWRLKPEALDLIPGGTTFLSFPLPFQRSSDSNGPDNLWLDDLHWSLDCGGVPSIGLPMLWSRSPSYLTIDGVQMVHCNWIAAKL